MDRMYLPIKRDWRLNERHYGSLQGLNKAETAAKYGDEQVLIWRRSYDVPPPPLETSDERYGWLNSVQAVGKGTIEGPTLTYEWYEAR